jgi:hypothetical protein
LGRVDAWTMAPDGILYGGNAGDGQLFKLDPETGRVTNLGKPVMMPRITGLTFGATENSMACPAPLPAMPTCSRTTQGAEVLWILAIRGSL